MSYKPDRIFLQDTQKIRAVKSLRNHASGKKVVTGSGIKIQMYK